MFFQFDLILCLQSSLQVLKSLPQDGGFALHDNIVAVENQTQRGLLHFFNCDIALFYSQ
jgi:hypothetical protein